MVGVEQQRASIGELGTGRLNIGSRLHAHGFKIRPVELTAEVIVFVAVELNHVYRYLTQDLTDNVRLFVHKQRDCRHKRRQHRRDFPCLHRRYRAFAFGVKHQPDCIRARLGGSQCVFGAGDAADFDTNGFHQNFLYGSDSALFNAQSRGLLAEI